MATMRTGKLMSTAPIGTKFSNPDRLPSWKISVIAPNDADSDNRFSTTDFSGSTTEPNARNSTTNDTTATNNASHGIREVIMLTMSTLDAGMPVNSAVAPGGGAWARMS